MSLNQVQQDSPLLRVHEFFLARQPILDREQALFAYELLFRSAASGPAVITSDLTASAAVIAHVLHLGIEKVIGPAYGFLNADAAVLHSDIFQFLPRDRTILEILETTEASPALLDRIAQLRQDGFCFALDDVVAECSNIASLLPHADIVKLDLQNISPSALPALAQGFRAAGKKILAEKVEDREQFETCLDLGFDYFQGYYFARPTVLSGKKLSSSQMTIMKLLSMINADAPSNAIEQLIKQDISLCFSLLRLVNTPAIGARRRIDSIGQAVLVLGRSQLLRWLQVLLYAESSQGNERGKTALLSLAVTRGKLLELIAQQTAPGDSALAETAFTVGIMSLMDALFQIPMRQILEQVAVSEGVADALLQRGGCYGQMLRLAEHIERVDEAGQRLAELARQLHISSEQLRVLQLNAFEWSDQVARATTSAR